MKDHHGNEYHSLISDFNKGVVVMDKSYTDEYFQDEFNKMLPNLEERKKVLAENVRSKIKQHATRLGVENSSAIIVKQGIPQDDDYSYKITFEEIKKGNSRICEKDKTIFSFSCYAQVILADGKLIKNFLNVLTIDCPQEAKNDDELQ